MVSGRDTAPHFGSSKPGGSSKPDARAPSNSNEDEPGIEPPQAEQPLVAIRVEPGCPPVDTVWLRDGIDRVIGHVQVCFGTVAVQIVTDESMLRFHHRHSGVATTTDVLTFPSSVPQAGPCPEPPQGQPGGQLREPARLRESVPTIDVDLVLCRDEAARRADERNHPVERELLLYALHGLLHCAGYDDHEPADYERMHAEEDRILEAVGIGATFFGAPFHASVDGVQDAESDPQTSDGGAR